MYKIIGADNTEYGPVSGEKICEWIQQRRVNSETKIRPEGSTEWKRLGEMSEFAAILPRPGAAPPVMAARQNTSAKLSGLAIASLVLGILGWFTLGISSLFGLGLGIWALIRINRSQGQLRGMGLALTGTILSGILVMMLPILAALMLPALAKAKQKAQSIVCMNNLKQLALGELMYANDNKERFSDSDHWCDSLGKYVNNPKVFLCPTGDSSQRSHYAFNARLSGIDPKQVTSPSETVMFFEADGGWNLSGGADLVTKLRRHGGRIGLVFADGHAEIAGENRLRNIKWEP